MLEINQNWGSTGDCAVQIERATYQSSNPISRNLLRDSIDTPSQPVEQIEEIVKMGIESPSILY
jgi:hypothetical protein